MFSPSTSYHKLDEENVKSEEISLNKKNQKRGKKFKNDESKPLLDHEEEELEEESPQHINREDGRKSDIKEMKQIEDEMIQIVEKENYSLENYGNEVKTSEESDENRNQSPIGSPDPSDAMITEWSQDLSHVSSEPTRIDASNSQSTNPFQDEDSHALVLLYKSDPETLDSKEQQTDSTPFEKTTADNTENAPPKPPKPQLKSTNPFADEDSSSPPSLPPTKTLQKSKSLNPFDDTASETITSSSNPFSPDYTPPASTSHKATKPSNQMKKSQSAKPRSTNPFDSDDSSPAAAAPSRRSPNLFKSPSSPSSIGTPPQSPSSRPSLTRFSEHSPEYLDLVTLLQLGFLPSQAYHSLQIHKDLPSTLQSLRIDLLTALAQKAPPNWYPPVLTRIGSWMPSQANSSSRVLYYIKVQLNHSDIAYVVTKRFSECVDFYYRVSPHFQRNCQILPPNSSHSPSQSLNPTNVMIPFVDDRVSGYLWGTSEELCNRRQDMLHKWLSYLCLSERMMTDLTIHKLVVEFLQIDHFVKRVPVLTGIPERPLTLQ
jgi:hypothetical protein